MIIKKEKLEELKLLQSHPSNELVKEMTSCILKKVWPESDAKSFCQQIESIGLTWMNQFLILIENFINQASTRYIAKLQQFSKCFANQQTTSKLQQYLQNFSKYIQSMQYPLLTSINNIHNLYMKFPDDQVIQEPKKPLSKQTSQGQFFQIKKKKSLSIQSFTSNIPTKSRSTSKSRKLSFFKNSVKPHQSIFQTLTKEFKHKQNLNTTVKKVKKSLPFSKTAYNSKQGWDIQRNQKQNNDKRTSDANHLKQKLQQRLANTCSSTFFNQALIQKPESNLPSFAIHPIESKNQTSYVQQKADYKQNPSVLLNEAKIQKEKFILQQEFKKDLLEQIQMKEKKSYDNLVKDIQSKLNDKFQLILGKIIQQKNENGNSKKQQENSISISQKDSKIQMSKIQNTSMNLRQQKQTNLESFKQKVTQNTKEQSRKRTQQNDNYSDLETVQAKEMKSKTKILQNKINSSSILQKDPSKIIKSKLQNSSTHQNQNKNKQITPQKKTMEFRHTKPQQKSQNIKSQISSTHSIDSIDIIDDPIVNTNKQNSQNIQSKLKSTNQNQSNLGDKKIESFEKIEDNFYTKRIKQLKNRMEICIKNYKLSSEKLILPVNETFMLLFSFSYQYFCKSNSLAFESRQVEQFISKYSSENELKSKLPANEQKFIIDSLVKIQKMVNLKCPSEKKLKIEQYTENCISCIENVFFQKPDLKLQSEAQINKKISQIKKCLQKSKDSNSN